MELQKRCENSPTEEQHFALYVSARYDKRAKLSETELDGLKKTLFARKK